MGAHADISTFPIAILPGAANAALDLSAFADAGEEPKRIAMIQYPDWRRYVCADFSADTFIRELAEDIASRAAGGRIGIVGYSLGGHLGYLVALRLLEMGVDVAGFCAIDSFMVASADLRPGWTARLLEAALPHIRSRSFKKLRTMARHQFWRGLMRLSGAKAPALLRLFRDYGGAIAARDPIFDQEVSMRLLLRAIAPWLGTLDRDPPPLTIPTLLIRTDLTRGDDPAWRRRCPHIQIIELPGNHNNLFDAENIDAFRGCFLGASRAWR